MNQIDRGGLVDTHAHVMDTAFDADRDAVLARARHAGLAALVLVGYDLATSRAAVALARQIGWARATVGIHPNSAATTSDADFAALAALAREPEVVGIGETGLDYYREYTPHAQQREAFAWHLRLADELSLPAIVHNREADADVGEALATRRPTGLPAVLHCFNSPDPAYLAAMLHAGCFVSFAGTLTFSNAAVLREMAARVPLDRLLVETDCPYLAPVPHRGKRNEPAFVRDTVTRLADIVGLTFELLVERLWTNTLRVFPALESATQEVAA